MHKIPETASGDVLYILDASFSASAAIYDRPEMLLAASWGDIAGTNLQTSFTRIINELKDLEGNPCLVVRIFTSIHWNTLSNIFKQAPFTFQRRVKKVLSFPKCVTQSSGSRILHGEIDALDPAEHRILITVKLQVNIGPPGVREWKNWLTANIPSRVLSATITIEAVFRGSYSLLLVSLPICVWTMIPAEEAYSFVFIIW
jgi:hypothetical protein